MKNPKFNFVPERQINKPIESNSFRISIYKTGTMIFPSEIVSIYDLDGKYIRLYADREKRSIGWSFFDKAGPIDDLKDARQLTKTVNGNIVVSIKKLLHNIGIDDLGNGYKQLEVGTYKSTLQANSIYYVTLPQQIISPIQNKPHETAI